MGNLPHKQLQPNSPEADCWVDLSKAVPINRDRLKPGQAGLSTGEHPEAHMAWLVQTIESEIIPRLMAAHQATAKPTAFSHPAATGQSISQAEIVEFSELVLENESAVCQGFIREIQGRGVALQTIYLDLLAPAARRLGELWLADQCHFTDVTIGLWRMQQVMYDLSPVFQGEQSQIAGKRKIMLTTVPGSQHTLGILMVVEFFRRAGWNVWSEPGIELPQLLREVGDSWFDIVGISISAEPQLKDVPELIANIRQKSKNPSISIMVGGPLLVAHPEYAEQIGADVASVDIHDAIAQAERLVAHRDLTREQKIGLS
jgi:MerR family transcriptional regulator, light-induced transcriptional regulator